MTSNASSATLIPEAGRGAGAPPDTGNEDGGILMIEDKVLITDSCENPVPVLRFI